MCYAFNSGTNKTGGARMEEKIKAFAELLEAQQIETLRKKGLGCVANIINAKVTIKSGKKYVKVDVERSGKYMIDEEGQIFGVKAYGVIHRGHYYGTVDTKNEYYWGEYTAFKI